MQELEARDPFLDDLAEDFVLISFVLRKDVTGRDNVYKVVKAGGAQYVTQTPSFLGTIGDHSYFEYEATLSCNEKANGLVSMRRNAAGEVTHLNIAFSPLSAVLGISEGVRDRLKGVFDPEYFL